MATSSKKQSEFDILKKHRQKENDSYSGNSNTQKVDKEGYKNRLLSIINKSKESDYASEKAAQEAARETAMKEWQSQLGIGDEAFKSWTTAYSRLEGIKKTGGTNDDWYQEMLAERDNAALAAEEAKKVLERKRDGYWENGMYFDSEAHDDKLMSLLERQFEDAQKRATYANNNLQYAESLRYDDIEDRKDYDVMRDEGRKIFDMASSAAEKKAKAEYDRQYEDFMRQGTGGLGFSQDTMTQLRNDTSWREPQDAWAQEEKDTFYYLFSQNRDEAYKYAENLNNFYNAQKAYEQQKKTGEWATQNVGTGALATAGALAAAPFSIGDFLDSAVEYAARGTVTQKDTLTLADRGNAMTSAIVETLNSKPNAANEALSKLSPVFGEVGVGDLYSVAFNALQSLTYGAVGGAVGAGIAYFGIGAKSGFEDAVSRGATPGQALVAGLLDGTIEQLTETYSIDKLLNIRTPSTFAQLLKNTLVQGGIEASEETMSALLGSVGDAFVMGDKSALNASAQEYMLQGMSYEEAQKQATKDWLKEVAYSAASGFLSGGFGATVQSGRQAFGKYQGDAESLIQKGLNTPEGSRARLNAKTLANKVDTQNNKKGTQDERQSETPLFTSKEQRNSGESMSFTAPKGGRITNLQAQRLTELIAQEEAKSRLNAQGVEADNKTLDAIGHALSTNDELSRREKAILQDEKVGDVATQMRVSEILGREWDYDNQKDKDPVIKSNYDVSEDGKTIDTTTGEEVTIEKIASLKNGKMTLKLSNGKVVSSDSVSYGSNGEALIYETVASLDTLPVIANELVRGYDTKSGVSPEVYARGIQEAFVYGQYNLPESEMLAEGTFSADLTAEQRQLAYKSGQKFSGMAIAKQQAEIKKGKAVAKVGAVANQTHINDFNPSAFDISTEQGQRQRASYNVAKMMSEVLGVDIYVFESYVKDNKRVYIDENGNEVEAPNGYYKNGAIHIDLNAGNNGEGTMLFTLSHELTHFIREWSPAKFKVLANFLNEQYGKKGISIDVLVRQQMKKARDAGRVLTYDEAYEEFVADSMETMLTDGKVAEKLALLKQQDKNLWQKIRDFISDIYAKVVKAYEGMNPNSAEGKYVSEMVDALENLQQLFAEGLAEASANYQGSFTPDKAGTVFPTKDSAFGSMKDLIESGLEEDAIIEGKRERGLSAIVDEIEKSLPRTEAEIEEVEVKQADRALEAGAKYSFRGVTSNKKSDMKKLATAQDMLASGIDSEKVRLATGWFKGYDGKWRNEIDDSSAEFMLPQMLENERAKAQAKVDKIKADYKNGKIGRNAYLNKISTANLYLDEWRIKENISSKTYTLGEMLKHPQLYAAYPSLKKVPVRLGAFGANTLGAFHDGEILLNEKEAFSNPEEALSTILHEAQHIIQTIEGFAVGSTPAQWAEYGDGYDLYHRTAGEIEARDVENRLHLSEEERKNTRPDIDRDNVVFAESQRAESLGQKQSRYQSRGNANLLENEPSPVFYSQMAKVVDSVKQEKFGASSVVNMLKGKGVKNEEIKWSGIETWLEGKKSVTKAELLEFIQSSMLQIDEETLTNEEIPYTQKQLNQIAKFEAERDTIAENLKAEWKRLIGTEIPITHFGAGLESAVVNNLLEANATKKNDTETGRNYKTAKDDLKKCIEYSDDYFGYENAKQAFMAAVRNPSEFMTGSELSDLEKSVFQNFIKAKEAFKKVDGIPVQDQRALIAIAASADKFSKKISEVKSEHYAENAKHMTKWGQYKLDGGKNYRELLFKMPDFNYSNNAMYGHWGDRMGVLAHARIQDFNTDVGKMLFVEEIQSDWHNEGHKTGYESVPDAPFRDNYHEYVLKRLIREAAEKGYNSIGWTTAAIQSDRWSDEYAEGYRIEYDQDIPKFLNKYGKKWGTKVEKTILKNGTEVWHMAITDSMQKSVLTEGQPLYQTRGNANLEKVNAVLEKQNAKLREDVKELKELLKLQKSVTNGTKLTPSSVEAVSKKLMRDIHSKGEVSELKALLGAFYSEVRNNESTSLEDYRELAQPVVDWLHDHMVTEETKQDASAFAYESDLIEQDIFSQVLSSYWDVSTLHTVADVKQKQINELKAKHNARTAELKNIKREVAALKEAHKEEVARIRTEAREERLAAEREIIRKYQESRKNSVESRAKTAEKAKIRKKISAINKLLNRGTKERNVKEGLQEVAAQALKTADILFTETYSDNDMIRDGIQTPMTADEKRYMAEAKSLLDRISKLPIGTDERNNLEGQLSYRKGKLKDVLFRERARLYDADVSMALDELAEAYDKIKDSPYSYIAEAYDEEVANMLKTMNKEIGGKKIRDMTLENLELVNDVYTMVLTTIRNANKSFANSKDISEMGDAVVNEVRAVGGHKKMRGVISNAISQFGWNNMKPVYAFKAIGSDTLSKLFDNVRAGEDTWARDVYDARSFFRAQAAKTGYDKWDMAKSYTFTSTSGLEFSLTLEQMMSLYAFSKREQALDHLRKGGIVFDENTEVNVKGKLGIKQKFNPSDATAYNISAETLAEITGKLSKQQIAFVDAMQDYLSTTMGEKGNEVSMALYGVKLFKEKFYFPLRSATQYQERAKEAGKRERKVKNSGFTKPTTPKAGNPIVLAPFMDVWSQHVNDMSMYHAFVLPMEDFYKVYNYKTAAEEDTAIESVNAAIQNAYGKGAINYIDTLLKDLNGGARTDPSAGFINKAMGLFKKGAVFASASVVIQQPSAIARAFAMVDSKYFVGKSLDTKKHKALWEEVKKYAPVAMIKEMGHFDTNMGKSTEDFIKAKEYGSWEEKFKGIVTDGGYRDDVLSKAPALADELAWCKIWNAVKLETADKHKNLKVGSEEFLQAAGKRFTEVIVNTQVYDSVLSRSANMRSKDTGMKMATAFLAEPTTAINMVTDALIQGKRGNAKNARRIIGSVIGAQILNAALSSFVYAARDDDEDETYWEKYLASFLAETKDSLNPATYIPFLKDIVSLVQGYEVERSDMAVIADIVNAYKQLDSDKISGWRKVENFAGGIAQFFGLPVKNIMRDARALWQVVDNAFNGESYTAAGAKYAVKEALTHEATSNGEQLLNALIEGDKAHEERVRARFKDESAATSAIRSAIKAGFESGEFDEQTATDLLM